MGEVNEAAKLLEEMRSESAPTSTVVTMLQGMSDSDREAVLTAMGDDKVSTKAIHKVLNRNGHEVSYDAVRRFRGRKVAIPTELEF